ncbi:ATP-binding protein [Candidatus Dojkabacteria bacterium]|nr:ATP-binding protein [Candidatus Dojkabacteria bacterium]
MEVTEQQKKAIELLNPWHTGKKVDLGILRTGYLTKISDIVNTRKQILFILGSRRVGKTVTLFQYIHQLINQGVSPKTILFLSLDNTNLEGLDLFTYLTESKYKYIFLDEVHYFPKWAQILKSLYDLPNNRSKIICSGSSSKLIEDNKAFLTGRSTSITIYPLSYIEFQKFNKNSDKLDDYLYYGGYPEYVLEKQPNYLNELLRDVIEKDISKLHSIKNNKYLFDICEILAKQIGFKGSSNKIAKVLGLDNKTALNYIEYLREVKLIETVYQYSDSLNERLYAPKKYYFNDLGMRNSFVGFSDIGSLVENAVFIKLDELYGSENIYYLSDTTANEVDFVVTMKNDEVIFIESKYRDLQESILNSLSKSFSKDIFSKKVARRVVITNSVDEKINFKNVEIELISLVKFLERSL